jgi:hypothetical protein
MTITFNNIGKTYKVSSDNTVEVTHHHDAIVSICGGYFKNKHTGEWLSELEVEQAICQRYEEDEENRYY